MNRRDVALLALVLGLLAAAHPVYLDVHPGESKVLVEVDPTEQTPPADEVVNFTDLPPRAQAAVEQAGTGGEATLWIGSEADAIEPLAVHDYLRWEGDLYRVRVVPREGLFDRVDTVVSPLVSLVGVLLAVISVRTLWDVRQKGRD
ncbi:hypothetical protein [Haloarchaeobius amylolyticus]|uniref:hypothetical protein n=1 Tax=Haloarchaeobius amylolyticus TaxID=1198296 RepID=UPI00226E3746|nr:hypothetical protein [Haloarchaeobius amylolyticus]